MTQSVRRPLPWQRASHKHSQMLFRQVFSLGAFEDIVGCEREQLPCQVVGYGYHSLVVTFADDVEGVGALTSLNISGPNSSDLESTHTRLHCDLQREADAWVASVPEGFDNHVIGAWTRQ